MSSSEIKDSGKLSGQNKSNFSQTCSLLSQYLKEKGSFGDLTLSLSNNFQPHGASTKPGQNMDGPTRDLTKMEPEKAQMTIFYAGQVIVFDDFPADKVKEIMGLANKVGSENPNIYSTATMVPKPAASVTNLVSPASNVVQSSQLPPQPLVNDLPIARKASLARFFEKRKDRITASAPYQTSNSAASSKPPAENKTWLGLAAKSPMAN